MGEKETGTHKTNGLRKRAEQKLPHTPVEISNLSREKIQGIIEDLHVHQIELEAQNEELKQAHEELKQARDKYADLYDFAPIGYLTIANNTILDANLTVCQLLGDERNKLIGKRITEYIDRQFQDTYYFHQRQAINTRIKQVAGEVLMHRADSISFYARLESIPSGKDQLRIAVIDITAEKQAKEALIQAKQNLEIRVQERTQELAEINEQLKQYGRRITQVQEEERKRIAYELHDDTAQYLAILKLQLDSILQSGKIQDPDVKEKLKYLEKDADRALNDIRRYSHELRPGVLEHLGLQAALEQIVEDINKLKIFTIELHVEGAEQELSEEVKLGLFRIVQEALNNVRKHSKASSAEINLQFWDSCVKVMIKDDGIGFDLKKATGHSNQQGSLGLMSMQERARLIGAELKIESKPGRGTTVEAEIKV